MVRGYLHHEDQLYARCVRNCKVAIGSLIPVEKFALGALHDQWSIYDDKPQEDASKKDAGVSSDIDVDVSIGATDDAQACEASTGSNGLRRYSRTLAEICRRQPMKNVTALIRSWRPSSMR